MSRRKFRRRPRPHPERRQSAMSGDQRRRLRPDSKYLFLAFLVPFRKIDAHRSGEGPVSWHVRECRCKTWVATLPPYSCRQDPRSGRCSALRTHRARRQPPVLDDQRCQQYLDLQCLSLASLAPLREMDTHHSGEQPEISMYSNERARPKKRGKNPGLFATRQTGGALQRRILPAGEISLVQRGSCRGSSRWSLGCLCSLLHLRRPRICGRRCERIAGSLF